MWIVELATAHNARVRAKAFVILIGVTDITVLCLFHSMPYSGNQYVKTHQLYRQRGALGFN